MHQQDIALIEHATIAAVSPQMVHTLPGWLLPMDEGTIGRSHSAVPLSHAQANAALTNIEVIIQAYAQHGMQAKFRLPDVPAFTPLCAALESLGYQQAYPTLVQIGSAHSVLSQITQVAADVENAPDEGWAAVFLNGEFSPSQGQARVSSFRKSSGAVFASVRQSALEGGATIAIGAGALSHGWMCLHGVNTLQGHRGQGLAGRVLAGLAQAALQRGTGKLFLQVEQDNTSALALYQRLGFRSAWKYVYWQLPITAEVDKASC